MISIHTKKVFGDDGFTLIELAIVTAIAGIVSLLAIGGYMTWKPGNTFRGAVSQVRADLSRAKMRAVETRRQCRVVFTTNGIQNVYQIEDGDRVMNSGGWGNLDTSVTPNVHTPGTPFRTMTFADFPQITLLDSAGAVIAAGANEPTITFSPRGTARNDSVRVVHPTEGFAIITVNVTGMVNITWP